MKLRPGRHGRSLPDFPLLTPHNEGKGGGGGETCHIISVSICYIKLRAMPMVYLKLCARALIGRDRHALAP